MKKLNKRKIALVSLLAIIIIIELLALGFSRAEKIKEINFIAVDYEGKLENYIMPINAYDEGASGYYITLPEEVDKKQVEKYIVEEKKIISQSVENENIEETIENEIVAEVIDNTIPEENILEEVKSEQPVKNIETVATVEKLPGDRVFITEEELTNAQISIKVVYDTKKDNEGNTLYNMQIANELNKEEQQENSEENNEENKNRVEIKSYFPIDVKLNLEENLEEVSKLFDENTYSEEYNLKQIYTLKFLNNDLEYISEENEFIIKIPNINKDKQYKVLQLDEQNNLVEIEKVEKEEDVITFVLDNLQTFAVLEDNTIPDVTLADAIEQNEGSITLMFANSLRALANSANSWDGSTSTEIKIGNGTQEFPYLISNGAELAYLAEQVDAGNSYEGVYFQLATDIDLNGKEWNPIGTYNNPFRGIFDGAGHIIANGRITISSLATSVNAYGIFASIGGGNSKTEIRNVEFQNINITLTASGNTSSNTTEKGYNIGIVTGTMFRNSTIKNVIVKGSNISDTNTITIYNNSYQVLVGGIAGNAINSASSTTDPGGANRYSIDNCFASVNIELDIALRRAFFGSNLGYAAQYNVGGIIGRIRSQPVWPTNCLFEGNIKATNGFIGPIFGTVRNNTSLDTNNYATLWNGNDAGNGITMNSYYMNYTANGTVFTADVTSGNSTSRISNSTSNIGYVQGVNKGLYTNDKAGRLANFNNNAGGNYVSWKYENNDLSLIPRLSATAVEIQPNIHQIQVNDQYNIGNYTYTWYINGEIDSTITGDTSPEQIPTFDIGYQVRVLVYDGTYYAVTEYEIPKLYIDIEFNVNKSNDSVTAYLVGSALPYVNLEDYTYQWYKIDIIGDETLLEGENSLTLTGLENGMEYRLIATNTKDSRCSAENSFVYGDRVVVFVDYSRGSNNNDGFTPETAVETMSEAYSKLGSNGTRNENVIVVIGNYNNFTFFNSATGTTYAKNATITGKYAGIDYNANLRFGNSSDYYRYLTADLNIVHMTLNGNNGSMYLLCQGNSLTIGEQVTMSNYATANSNQGLLGNRAPAFHLFAGWYQYNRTSLPKNNSKIILKSGTYGRVILGGTPGSSSGQGQTTSHDFTGSADDPFRVSITIDIKNSTTASNYDYDVNLLVGGSAAGNNYSVINEEIISGKLGRVLGGSIGDSATRPRNWNYPENTFLGETTIDIKGGSINELYGGCLGRNMDIVGSPNGTGNTCDSYFYGKININITGGTVTGNIYGAGAGGVTGYSANSSDPYKSYGQSYDTEVDINIAGGSVQGNIYGGGYGYTEYLNKNVTADDGGTLYGNSKIIISGNPTINGNIYGAGCGYNFSGKPNLAQMVGNSDITISGTPTINGQIYGAGAGVSGYGEMAKLIGQSSITIGANLTKEVFGGGNIAKLSGTSLININSGTHKGYIYGGGNIGILEGTSHVYINGGTQEKVFGGGNEAQATTTNVYIKGGNSKEVYGGGNAAAVTTTNVYLQGGTTTNIFGGSNQSGDIEKTNVTTTSGTSTYIYGGNNRGGSVSQSNVVISGGELTTVYGGNNAGGRTTDSNVRIENGTIENVLGGGNEAETDTTHVDIVGGEIASTFGGGNKAATTTTNLNIKGGTITNAYGGGNQAKATTTNVTLEGGTTENIFGGSNESGDVNNSNVVTMAGTANNLYGGNNKGGIVTKSVVTLNGGNLTNVYGGGNLATVDTTNVYGNGGIIGNIYGGGNQAGVNTSTLEIKNGEIGNVFGGSNQSGDVNTSKILVDSKTDLNLPKIDNVYGGNNQGGVTQKPDIEINSGTIGNVYGGGNQAIVPATKVTINNGNIENIFGGGNAAVVNTNTSLIIAGGNISNNVYGGGNEGIVLENTNVEISGGTILGSAYAGGNGQTAIVYKNANITIQGNAIIGSMDEKVSAQKGSVFGGGNAAATGEEGINNSISTVNIVGGTIYGNVYGGANTSVVYGYTNLKLGYEAVKNHDLQRTDIYVRGTLFGGGEANATGSEEYDYSFISVTKGITMLIDGTGHNEFRTEGSIFGSGNASSTSGESHITIKNYGAIDDPCKNISIQRATTVTLDNVAIVLSGATDRTNEFDKEKFTLSRVDHLKIKNNSTIYLNCGANLLQQVSSLTSNDELATVTIEEDGTTTKNVDNRIYLLEGKNLNIATNENATTFGNVNGMTFLGLYTNEKNPSTSTGLYHHSFDNGEEITNLGTFSRNSYVEGRHKENHDTHVDGFYTNFNNEGKIKTGYIGVTPEVGLSYIWLVGEKMDVTVFEISLTASKYATLGTVEQPLTNFGTPNTKFQIIGFSSGLESDVTLIDGKDIQAVASDEKIANNVFGLSMRTGKNGWQSNNATTFLTTNGALYQGDSLYLSDNSQYTPSLTFCLYHSQNLTEAKELGKVTIRFQAIQPIDELNNYISYIDIIIDMTTELFPNDFYEAAISPGEEFELFTTTETTITDKSIFSTYYSLLIKEFSKSNYYENYAMYKRVLVSRNSEEMPYVFPANTKLTMLDMVTNKYYYYIVTQEDEASGKYIYNLDDFIGMGSKDVYYDERNMHDIYYVKNQDLVYENYIFHVDVKDSKIKENVINNTLFIELQDTEGETLLGVLGIQRTAAKYSIYTGKSSTIDVTANVQDTIYLGDTINLTATTDFIQDIIESKVILDTQYFDSKMGLKITIHDSKGNQLNSDTLLGVNFEYNGVLYYPRIDGSVRIKVADKVSNVLSRIKINTENNSTIATGTYTIKVESFGSPDGIYYGTDVSDYAETKITIINGKYGLKVSTDDNSKIVDKVTGNTMNGNNSIATIVEYSSALEKPNIIIELQRRNYQTEYSTSYEKVDFKEYFANEYIAGHEEYEYSVIDNPAGKNTVFLYLKENLMTGTYKIVFKLYDGKTYIGEAYEYIIIQ